MEINQISIYCCICISICFIFPFFFQETDYAQCLLKPTTSFAYLVLQYIAKLRISEYFIHLIFQRSTNNKLSIQSISISFSFSDLDFVLFHFHFHFHPLYFVITYHTSLSTFSFQ
ncbi:hypothetical protein MtrunA17_Chr1g0182311 [Medicago truncatula]|uniref:Transmembrane protein n=1 Tax=Medicago truncatula TaxID=3880 RepID=A0A396JQZ8_MEDTR|nr:hypothetical protein MtrunA17_Chr1g0182311 [Medicago truncatula]